MPTKKQGLKTKPTIYSITNIITNKRYIGKTIKSLNRRLTNHLHAKNKSYKTSWIKSLAEKGLTPEIELIEIVDENDWQSREKYWISFYRKSGANLCNHTDGGEGQHGRKASNNTRAKMSKSQKGSKKQPLSESTKLNLSNSLKEYWKK